MNGKAVMWATMILVSAMTVGLIFLVACAGDDDDDDGVDDDLTDDDLDDDSDDDLDDDNDDDLDDDSDDDTDDDIDDDTVINSCEEIPRDGLGDEVTVETLVCNGQEMFAFGDYWEEYGDGPQPTTILIRNEEELEAAFPDDELPCEVDFEQSMIVGAIGYSGSGLCSSIEICGVYDDDTTVTVLVYYDNCHEDGPTETITPYHFVTVAKSDLPVEFVVYKWTHY